MSKPIQLATNKHRILLGKEATRIQVDLDLQVQSSITTDFFTVKIVCTNLNIANTKYRDKNNNAHPRLNKSAFMRY